MVVPSGNPNWGGNTAPDGSYYVVLQNRGSYVEQTVGGLRPGYAYSVQFWVTERTGRYGNGNDETMRVVVDGVAVTESLNPPATFTQMTAVFVASTDSAVVRFENDSPDGSYSIFLDGVSVTSSTGFVVSAAGRDYFGRPRAAATVPRIPGKRYKHTHVGDDVYDRGRVAQNSATQRIAPSAVFPAAGVITSWEYFAIAGRSGAQNLQVWRPVGGQEYELVCQNAVSCETGGVSYQHNIEAANRCEVAAGDVMGWYASGQEIIPYTYNQGHAVGYVSPSGHPS
eukprot:COSAG02_NODE_14809_length_1234_cov_1.156828_2_plen_282_part_01